MQSHSVTLKATPAGRMFLRFLAAFNSGDPVVIGGFISEYYADDVIVEFSVKELLDHFMALYQETGGLQIHKVYFTQQYTTTIVVKAKANDEMYLDQLRVSEDQPHQIVEYLHNQPID
jgi:hypothetical protein